MRYIGEGEGAEEQFEGGLISILSGGLGVTGM